MNSTRWAVAALSASTVALAVAPQAQARAPKSSTLVQETTPSALGDAKIDGASLVAGIAECRKALNNDSIVKFTFETTYAVAEEQDSSAVFSGPYIYSLARGTSTNVNCTDGEPSVECEDMSSDSPLMIDTGEVVAEVPFEDLVGFSNAELCESEQSDLEHFVQVHIDPNNNVTGAVDADYVEGRVVVDLIRPEAPVTLDGMSTATTMLVNIEPSSSEDVSAYFAVVSTTSFEGGVSIDDLGDSSKRYPVVLNETTNTGEVSVDLAEGTVVHVSVVAKDDAENYSLVPAPVEVEVVPTKNFWDYYQEAGGSETGGYGCASAGGGSGAAGLWALLVALLGLGLTRVRRAGARA
ncbi:hypothetical protein [Lujinxingia litoralis]|nr:hypothetical protein [Lujinxingia litoralis]